MYEQAFRLQKWAIILDFLCIIVSATTLILAYKQLVPLWGLVGGAVAGALLLVCSLYCFIKGRKLNRQAMEQEYREFEEAEREAQAATSAQTQTEEQ